MENSVATPAASAQSRGLSNIDLYRAVWRWHFYAGLLVLPFMILLAVTGALYLFRDEIDQFLHADLMRVEAQQGSAIAPERQTAAALQGYPGEVFKYVPAAAENLATEVDIKTDAGEKLAVYVNPNSGAVLGAMDYRGSVMWFIRKLHSLEKLGPIANGALEIAAGLSILLVITGTYLWWPRGQNGGVMKIRGSRRERVFWRDLHAVSGVTVGGFILFLAITGMPWSIVWGDKVNELANGNNFGYPAGVRVDVPMSRERLSERVQTSWSLEQAQIPSSVQRPANGQNITTPIGLDQAVARFDALGLAPGYSVNLPSSSEGVYTGSVYPDDLSQQRVVHLDQYSGRVLIDMNYADYGPLGRGLEWGINVHMGQEFGIWNQVVLALACVVIVIFSVSAGVMWWKRRPSGKLGVPPLPQNPRRLWGVLGLLMIGGIIFPLVGATLMVIAIVDF
ncbi:PepSY-associated TM helix domain-containing protein, partial [Marinobacter alexandrii]